MCKSQGTGIVAFVICFMFVSTHLIFIGALAWCGGIANASHCDLSGFILYTVSFWVSLGLLVAAIVSCCCVCRKVIQESSDVDFQPPRQINPKELLRLVKASFPPHWEVLKRNDCEQLIVKVVNVVQNTWKYQNRLGKDSKKLTHKGLKINAICILYNDDLIRKYSNKKSMMKSNNERCIPLNQIETKTRQTQLLTYGSEVDAAAQSIDNAFPFLDTSQNEEYLFHGTKKENISGIMEEGFSLERAAAGLYGKALYLAESSEKSDQYTDEAANRRRHNRWMILTRTLLGEIYVNEDNKSDMNMLELQDIKCDSAVAAITKENRFREFLIFNEDQCYPHIFVFYDRVNTSNFRHNIEDILCCVVKPQQ